MSIKLGLGPASKGSCLQAFIIKLYALHEEPAVLNNHPLPGATSLGKNATHVRNSCHEIRFEWKSKGNVGSLLQLGLIIPFPTRRLLFSLKRRASFLLGHLPIHRGTWIPDLKDTLPHHSIKASQPLSRKMPWSWYSVSPPCEQKLPLLSCGVARYLGTLSRWLRTDGTTRWGLR